MAPAVPLKARRSAKNVVYVHADGRHQQLHHKGEARLEDRPTHETFSHNGTVIVTWCRGA